MDKQEFLNRLSASLSQLPQSEISKTISYYSEMIDDMTEDGYTESGAIEALGKPEDIAFNVMQDMPITALVKSRVTSDVNKSKTPNILIIILLILGSPIWIPIAIALLAVVFSIYAVLWSLIIALFAVVIAVGVAGIACIFAPLFTSVFYVSLSLPARIGCGLLGVGLALLLAVASIYVTKALIHLSASVGRGIKSLFIKKRGN